MKNSETMEKNSPTCSKEGMRITMCIIASMNWECNSLDIKTAFLHGHPIEREVYLQPPPEFDNGRLWKLKKTVYGLCDAPRAWFIRLKDEVKKLGLTPCNLDPTLSYWYKNGKLEGVMCIHVDDILWGESENFIEELIVELESMFTIGSLEKINMKYLDLNINQD